MCSLFILFSFQGKDRGVSSRISLVESVVSARQSDSKVNDLLQVWTWCRSLREYKCTFPFHTTSIAHLEDNTTSLASILTNWNNWLSVVRMNCLVQPIT